MDPLSIVIFILKILGVFVVIGSIITVHEFGHFIAARMAGVEVHRFAIGLGPPIPGLTFRGKETEYAICWIPFGGYVKFRGQTDTPEIEITDNDPRSYQVKSVGWRMTIMTAGVAMNLVYGFFLYIAANLVGVPFNPAVIGASFPKQPAWEAGIREGDKLISINGVLRDDFDDIRRQVTLTDPRAETVVFVMERDGKRIDFDVRPVKESGKLQPQIGVIPSTGLRVLEHQRRAAPDSEQKLRSETPAGRMAPAPKFGDVIVAVDGAPVANYHEFNRKMFENREKPATLTFERKPKKEGQTPERYDGVVEPAFVRTLGLVAEIGKIEAVRKDSPAARATLVENGKPSPIQAGDIIKKIDGIEDFDPLKLPDLIAAKAAKGEPVEIVLIREGRQSEEIRVKTVPENIPPWNDFAEGWIYRDKDDKHPFSVPSLGLAYQVRNRIRKVDPEGPAAKANPPLQVGDRIVTVEYGYEGEKKVETFALDVEANWTQAFWNLQDPWIGGKVIVTVQRGEGAATVKSTVDAAADKTWPMHLRGFDLAPIPGLRKRDTIGGATSLAVEQTRSSISALYRMFRQMFVGNVSAKSLAGPLRIGEIIYQLIDWERIGLLLYFTAFLSINLMVINFLPIPVLDGGHMVFLIYEAIFRRRPNERFLNVATWMGVIFLGFVMIFVLSLDLLRFFGIMKS